MFLDSGTVVSCISPEISSINSEVIESVKVNRTLLLKNIDYSSAKEQTIYSSDELFAMLNKDSSEINVFNQSADEIINELLNQNDIRNKEQLIFLSKEMQSDKSKIHFTLKPIFGFLFLHEAKGKQHYIWELLNSHATYIWSINNPEQSGYWEIENELNIIRQSGRQAYRNAEKKDLQKKGLNFKVISHKLKAHSENSGFLRWKEALNEALK